MKKYLQLVIIFLLIFLCTGCVKFEENMTIKNNKSMNLELVVATDVNGLDSDMFNENEINNLSKFYSVSKYKDEKYTGYKLLWKTSNIDKISSSSDVVYSLSTIRESVPTNMFKVVKGFFSNTYYANFIFDPSSVESLYEEDEKNDLTFSVDLGKDSLDNNADKVKNDGKRLIWNLNSNDITEMSFSFKLYNYSRIVGVIIFGIIIFSLMVISYKKILEKRV